MAPGGTNQYLNSRGDRIVQNAKEFRLIIFEADVPYVMELSMQIIRMSLPQSS